MMPLPISKIKLFFSAYLLITLVLVPAYFNTLDNPFIWDDNALVIKNPLIKDWRLWPLGLTSDLYYGTSNGSNFYRPIQVLSYTWDYHFWQLNPIGFHITNIFLQSLVGFLIFLFLYILLKNTIISLAASLFFAVHPIHTEAVTYISGRAEMLLAIFLLSSLLSFIKAEDSSGINKVSYLSLSLFLFALGLLSKELAVAFPLVIAAYIFYFRRSNFKKIGQALKTILPFFILAAVYLFLRLSILKFSTLRPPALVKFPFLLRISLLPKVIFTYIKLLILPVNLHMTRELIRPTTFLGFFLAWFALGLMAVICMRLLKYREERRFFSFFLFWFFVFLLPQAGIFPINAFIAEHFIYLSSISFFAALSYLLYRNLRRGLFIFCSILILFFYATLTYSRNLEWSDPAIFFERIIKFSPDSFQAHNNLGLIYEKRREFDKAISHYQTALKIMPGLLEAHSNLADLYFKLGKFKDAEKEYLIVEGIAPPDKAGEVQNNIGALYEAEGELDEALARYMRALSLDPDLKFSHFNIAGIYWRRKNFALAAREIAKSIDSPPDTEKIIAALLKEKKDTPYAATFYNDLGVRFAQRGLFDQATSSFTRSVEAASGYINAHFNLGLAYLKKGLKEKAVSEFRLILKIDPHYSKAREILSVVNKKK